MANRLRTLYFDISGTVLVPKTREPKAALADGRLESAIRRASIEELVCVGNFVAVICALRQLDPLCDGLGAIFVLCGGIFQDERWFRSITQLAQDPENRAADISLDRDWWYVDDLAQEYMLKAGLTDVFREELGRRILVPSGQGDGTDIIEWIEALATGPQP